MKFKEKTRQPQTMEYERLGKKPIQFNPVTQQKDFKKPFLQQQKKIINQPSIEELELQEDKNNHGEIYENEILQNVANVKADPYSYLVVVDGECVELCISKEALEEFLEKLFFEEENDKEGLLNNIEIWKKLPPFKFGISVIE